MVRGQHWTGFEAVALQEAMRMSVREFAALLGIEATTITKWRTGLGSVTPRSNTQSILDTTLDLQATPQDRERFEQIVSEGEQVWRQRHRRPSGDAPAPSAPQASTIADVKPIPSPVLLADIDSEYVESLHGRIRQLVELDTTFGGDQSSGMALQLFRTVHRKLGAARCDPEVERDLYAAAGELGEVTGWLLYDAGKHDLVRQVNNEALQFSRLAGDRDMELLTLQNMSMHAGYLGRPAEALRIARMVLEKHRLSPRLKAMFRMREARALAQGGDTSGADRALAQVRSLYLDGVIDSDPPWVWWISDHELDWQEATVRGDAGEWNKAADVFHASVDAIPEREVRSRYTHLASLFNAQARAHAWHDAGNTLRRVVPFIEEIRSTRTATTLFDGIDYLDTVTPAPAMRDENKQLEDILVGAGYTR